MFVCVQALRYNYSSDEKYAFVEVSSVFTCLLYNHGEVEHDFRNIYYSNSVFYIL